MTLIGSAKIGVQCSNFDQTTVDVPNKVLAPMFSGGIERVEEAYSEILAGTAGTLFVLSAGNSAHDAREPDLYRIPGEPLLAALPDVVVHVGAAANFARASDYSSFGLADVFAFGGPWEGLQPQYGYSLTRPNGGNWIGTSFAAPAVAGIVALLLDVEPAFLQSIDTIRPVLVGSASATVDIRCEDAADEQPFIDAAALMDSSP